MLFKLPAKSVVFEYLWFERQWVPIAGPSS